MSNGPASKGVAGAAFAGLGPSDGRFAAGALASLARFLSDSGGAGASTTLSVASVRAAMGLRAAREAKNAGGENFVGDRSARRRA